MGAMKRELERLADIVIYGNAETIQREFSKAKVLDDDGGMWVVSYAIELARSMAPLCECGADYHLGLTERFPQWIQDTNEQSAAACNCDKLDEDLSAEGWTCYTCHETRRDNPEGATVA